MNKEIVEWLKALGYMTVYLDDRDEYGNRNNRYYSVKSTGRGDECIFLEWDPDMNYPTIKVFVCGDKSHEGNRRLIDMVNISSKKDLDVGLSRAIMLCRIKDITKDVELLERYTKFLQKRGYIDSDATAEEPYAIDEFLKEERRVVKPIRSEDSFKSADPPKAGDDFTEEEDRIGY